MRGALLKDPQGLLESAGENTQSARLMRFRDLQDIQQKEAVIQAYLAEAIAIAKAGLKVKKKETSDYPVPDELRDKLAADPAFKKAFEALTPGRQRGYLLHFAAAKQSSTRAARIEQYTPRIMDGKGFRDCVCGLSKKMPTCDGSHKYAKTP